MITNADYITGSTMLSCAQMNAVATQYEETPCQWLWDNNDAQLGSFVSLCETMDEWREAILPRAYLVASVRHCFRPHPDLVPSESVLAGLEQKWESIAKVVEAERSFFALLDNYNTPLDAAEKFLSMRAMLVLLRKALNEDNRTTEVWWWLSRIGWYEMLALADKRDHAARELIAGRAFSGSEVGIAVLPPDWSCRAAA